MLSIFFGKLKSCSSSWVYTGIANAVLTHSEVASQLLWKLSNNVLNVQVSDRAFWAVPGTGTAATLSLNYALQSSSSNSGQVISLTFIAVAVLGVLLLLLAAAILLRRQNRIAASKKHDSILQTISSVNSV